MSDKDQFYMNNPNLPKRGAKFEYTPEQIRDLKKSEKNILHFAEKFFYIIAPGEGRRRIKLHDCQKRILKTFVDNRFNITLASRQVGKALALDTPVPTPTGWTTMGDLKNGDKVFGKTGEIITVVKAHDILYDRDCYEITFSNGEKIVADGEHRWPAQSHYDRCHGRPERTYTTAEMYKKVTVNKKNPQANFSIPVAGAFQLEEKELPIDPYLLGYWLGDGISRGPGLSIGCDDVRDTVQNLNIDSSLLREEHTSDGHIVLWVNQGKYKNNKRLATILREQNLILNKHIPQTYLEGSIDQRLELLKGLMDSDGSTTGKKCVFYNTNETLIDCVLELVRSLGLKATKKTFTENKNPSQSKIGKPMFRVTFSSDIPVFKLKRKIAKQSLHNSIKQKNHYIIKIKKVKSVPVRCITVDAADEIFAIGKTSICSKNTTLMTIYALWVACFLKDQRILIVANKEATAIEIFRRVRLAYEDLPNWIKPPVKEYGKTSAEFENGSRIGITTTTSSAGRGSSCDLLILDELAHVENNLLKEFWAAVYPIISASKKSKILIASTPNGTDNLFYTLWIGAEKGENGWTPSKVHWSEIPGRDEEWARITKNSLESEDLWQQEFELQFHAAGQSAIDYEQLERFKLRLCEPEYILDDGAYRIYQSPSDDRVYVAGIDVAEGVGQDSSIIEVFDITDLKSIEQVAEYSNNEISPYNFCSKVKDVLGNWGNPLALIERNNQGAQIIDRLYHEENYSNIVSYGASKANRKKSQLGMISHTNTKYAAITNVRYWMNDLDSLRIHSKETLNEFKHFIRKPNKSWAAAPGFHDDRVMAIAWALMILHNDIVEQYFEVEERDENGRPSKIRPHDFGLQYFSNPTSVYTLADKNSEHVGMPAIFNDTIEDIDMLDLQSQGWEMLA